MGWAARQGQRRGLFSDRQKVAEVCWRASHRVRNTVYTVRLDGSSLFASAFLMKDVMVVCSMLW